MTLTLDVVMSRVGSGRSWTEGSGRWTRRFLDEADVTCEGAWQELVVSGTLLEAIALPPHAGEPCHGDTATLVGADAPTVAETSSRLRLTRDRYRLLNPSCAGRIEQAMAEPFSVIVLTTRALAAVGYPAGATSPAGLYVLDGLHRLVGWSLAGRLGAGSEVPVIVGGRLV